MLNSEYETNNDNEVEYVITDNIGNLFYNVKTYLKDSGYWKLEFDTEYDGLINNKIPSMRYKMNRDKLTSIENELSQLKSWLADFKSNLYKQMSDAEKIIDDKTRNLQFKKNIIENGFKKVAELLPDIMKHYSEVGLEAIEEYPTFVQKYQKINEIELELNRLGEIMCGKASAWHEYLLLKQKEDEQLTELNDDQKQLLERNLIKERRIVTYHVR